MWQIMQSIEVLLAIATGDGPVLDKARAMIGEDELALLIAKNALSGTSIKLSATKAAKAMPQNRTTLRDKIDRIAFKDPLKDQI